MKILRSKQRQKLWQLWKRMERLVQQLDSNRPLVSGTLYLMGRKCGKATCRCARGELHKTWVLTRSEEGRTRLYSVKGEDRSPLRRWTQNYRIYQRGRAALVKRGAELIRRVDQLAELQVVAWPSKKGRKR